jgi:hypothetical protein
MSSFAFDEKKVMPTPCDRAMSPEHALGQPADARSDIYDAGVRATFLPVLSAGSLTACSVRIKMPGCARR